MNALYSLILASGTKEALFAALWLALDEAPGTFADVDFASLRTTAARFGVELSESQIRKRVKELEKLDVLAVVPRRERGRFDLLVYQPMPNRFGVDATAPKPEPATPLFDAAFGKGVESFATPPVFAAVSETETRTETEPRSIAKTAPSEAERADALLARSPFADALRRAIWPKEYENIAWNVRAYQFPPDGFSDDEHDAMDSRVCELYAESRRIADEFDARAQRGEYAENGGSERRDAEREAALRAFAATRNPAIAPERSESEPVAAPLEEINNNKYIKNKTINKPAKDFERLGEDVATNGSGNRVRAIPERPAAPRDGSRALAVADVRELVDFESPKVAALRREIAEAVWEPTVHPDLIDRLTAAVVLRVGDATRSTVFALIREARDEKTLYERSNGKAGKRTLWQTATLRLKRLFENAGWVWSPTRFADEPRPTREPVAIDFDRSRSTPEPPTTETSERSVDELVAVAAGFEPSELDLSFADFARLVARRRGIADACESRGVALEIRNALRELAKRELATA